VGNNVKVEAKDVIKKANVVQISKAISIYQVFHGYYPYTFEELLNEGDIKEIPNGYTYQRSADGQSAVIFSLSENGNGGWCWNSESGGIKLADSESDCQIYIKN